MFVMGWIEMFNLSVSIYMYKSKIE